MKKVVTVLVALLLALPLVAVAGDVSGKIQSVDSSERAIVLEDGTKLWIAEGLPIDNLKEGAQVKASYEERDGKKVVTSIEVND